jgi:membrane protease YdiL (CAAX protease family)
VIPEHDPEPRPALTLEFVVVLALVAPLGHLLWVILLGQIGFKLGISAIGMGALITYGGLFALCAARFRIPPARQLAFGPAPVSAWLAVIFLVASLVVSSEVDNVVKGLMAPQPPEPPQPPETAPYLGAALAVVYIGVFPLVYDLFFRGVMQPLATTRIGVIPGVILTTLMSGFAGAFLSAVSLGLWALVPPLLNALILSILRQSAGSLWPVLALHVLWGVALICANYQVFGLAGFDAGGAHTPLVWVAGAALLTGVGLGLCRAAARAASEPASRATQG